MQKSKPHPTLKMSAGSGCRLIARGDVYMSLFRRNRIRRAVFRIVDQPAADLLDGPCLGPVQQGEGNHGPSATTQSVLRTIKK